MVARNLECAAFVPAHITVFLNASGGKRAQNAAAAALCHARNAIDSTITVVVPDDFSDIRHIRNVVVLMRSNSLGLNNSPPRVNLVVEPNTAIEFADEFAALDCLADGLSILINRKDTGKNETLAALVKCQERSLECRVFACGLESIQQCMSEADKGVDQSFCWDVKPLVNDYEPVSHLMRDLISDYVGTWLDVQAGSFCGLSAFLRTCSVIPAANYSPCKVCSCVAALASRIDCAQIAQVSCPYTVDYERLRQGLRICDDCRYASVCHCCPFAASDRLGCIYAQLLGNGELVAFVRKACEKKLEQASPVLKHDWDYQYVGLTSSQAGRALI